MGDNETAVPWRELSETEQDEWAEKVAGLIEIDYERRVVTVAGTCPTCGHGFDVSRTDDKVMPGMKSITWPGDGVEFVVRCTCTGTHPNRPESLRSGCGAGAWFTDEELSA